MAARASGKVFRKISFPIPVRCTLSDLYRPFVVMSISWMIDVPCSKFFATCRSALLILFLLLFILSKFPCVGSTHRQNFLGSMSDQIILAVEKTEARYFRSFLCSLSTCLVSS